jgi:hypothetical protein
VCDGAHPLDHHPGGKAEVREKAEGLSVAAKDKTDRFGGIVRDGEALNLKGAQSEGGAGLENFPIHSLGVLRKGLRREAVGKYGCPVAAAPDSDGGGVVGVLVGKEDAVYLLRRNPHAGQFFGDAFGAETGVNEHAGAGSFDEGAVARTTACKDRKVKHGNIRSSVAAASANRNRNAVGLRKAPPAKLPHQASNSRSVAAIPVLQPVLRSRRRDSALTRFSDVQILKAQRPALR